MNMFTHPIFRICWMIILASVALGLLVWLIARYSRKTPILKYLLPGVLLIPGIACLAAARFCAQDAGRLGCLILGLVITIPAMMGLVWAFAMGRAVRKG